ncbi:hypothetical protein [Streptomyces sp. NPDC056291]
MTVSASDTESGVAKIEYSLDGAAYAAYSAPGPRHCRAWLCPPADESSTR